MVNTTIAVDCCLTAQEVPEFKAWLKANYNLDCQVYPDSAYEGLVLIGNKNNIIKYLVDPNGYGEHQEWVQEFYPELLA